jgi:hypothetical protein
MQFPPVAVFPTKRHDPPAVFPTLWQFVLALMPFWQYRPG